MIIPFFLITVIMSIVSVYDNYSLYVDEDGKLYCVNNFSSREDWDLYIIFVFCYIFFVGLWLLFYISTSKTRFYVQNQYLYILFLITACSGSGVYPSQLGNGKLVLRHHYRNGLIFLYVQIFRPPERWEMARKTANSASKRQVYLYNMSQNRTVRSSSFRLFWWF
mgnify:CR=1 FL=1